MGSTAEQTAPRFCPPGPLLTHFPPPPSSLPQMVAGIDRYLFDHANYLWSYLAASGAFRAVSTTLGDQTRHYLQGLPNGDAVMRRRAALRAWAAQQAAQARGGVVVRTSPAPAAPAAAPAATTGSSSGAAAGGKKKRRSKKAAGGFEMGVGPAAAPVAA